MVTSLDRLHYTTSLLCWEQWPAIAGNREPEKNTELIAFPRGCIKVPLRVNMTLACNYYRAWANGCRTSSASEARPRGGTTASRDRHKLLTHQAFAKAISIHFLSRCFETSCVSREAFLACL